MQRQKQKTSETLGRTYVQEDNNPSSRGIKIIQERFVGSRVSGGGRVAGERGG